LDKYLQGKDVEISTEALSEVPRLQGGASKMKH